MKTVNFTFMLMCLVGAPSILSGAEWRFYSKEVFSRFIRELTGQDFYLAPAAWQIENFDGSLIAFKRRGNEIWILDKDLEVKKLRTDLPGVLLVDGLGRAVASMASPQAGPLMIRDRALPLAGDVSISADQRNQYVVVSPDLDEAEVVGRECYFEVYALETSERVLRVEGRRASGIVSIGNMLLIFTQLPTRIDGMTRIPGEPRVILYAKTDSLWEEKRRYSFEKPGLGSYLSYHGASPDGKSLLLVYISL